MVTKTTQHKDAHECVYQVYAFVRTLIYIQRGLSVACSVTKAIPEPLSAEQQHCSPAFLYVYTEWLSKSRDIYKVYIGCGGIRDWLDEPPMRE